MSSVPVKRASAAAWSLADSYCFIAAFLRRQYGTDNVSSSIYHSPSQNPHPPPSSSSIRNARQRRHFHDYFVTHLPVSSLHPDSRASAGPSHHFPRSASMPHTPTAPASSQTPSPSPATVNPSAAIGRETTVVRIPLRSAKHHFGVSVSRGTRPTTEDTYQAGVIEVPAFARRAPLSVTIGNRDGTADREENRVADSSTGDPQVFYFGVFDGHGGSECSEFLRDKLHGYVQEAASEFGIQSSLITSAIADSQGNGNNNNHLHGKSDGDLSQVARNQHRGGETAQGNLPILQAGDRAAVDELEKALVKRWKDLVGGYFRRFKPAHFSYDGKPQEHQHNDTELPSGISIEEVVEYAFLKADLEFVTAQVNKRDSDKTDSEKPLNERDILDKPSRVRPSPVGGQTRFKGGSTGSIAMISTPTPMPFWNPSAPSSLIVSHVGDTRILLCSTSTGNAIPLTTNHHPSSPIESSRLQRYAATFVTDSFGEERMSGLANTRAFGDIQSKRIGVSAEPEIRRVEMGPAEYSFLVLMSDGISGALNDQEIVDIVKEARTPDQGARDVVSFSTEVSANGDNATCLVVRLGGWERRQEGGLGSMATKESRDWRKNEASDPRGRRT